MRPHHNVSQGQSRLEYLKVLSSFLENRAEIHRFWKTHSSTYGCWICDLVQANQELLEMVENAYKLSPRSLGENAERYQYTESGSDNQYQP